MEQNWWADNPRYTEYISHSGCDAGCAGTLQQAWRTVAAMPVAGQEKARLIWLLRLPEP
ncbi:hypothetical protein GCM10022398_23910 [Acetobacter lovaniensis]